MRIWLIRFGRRGIQAKSKNWPVIQYCDWIVPSVFLTQLPLRLRASFINVMMFSALRFRSESCMIISGASLPRLSAITKRAEDQLLAPLRRGFSFLRIINSYSPVPVKSVANTLAECSPKSISSTAGSCGAGRSGLRFVQK